MSDEFTSSQKIAVRRQLRELYPQSFRIVFCRSFWFLLAMLVVVLSYTQFLAVSSDANPATAEMDEITNTLFFYIFCVVGIVLFVKLLYEVCYLAMYRYQIELEHITITKGVFFRVRGSFPLAKINDVSLKRTLIEMLFGLYSLDILTASPVADTGVIEGLNRGTAAKLQEYLLTMVETTLPDVKEMVAERILSQSLSSEAADRLIHANGKV